MSDFLNLRDDRSARRVVYVSAFLLITVPFLQAGAQLWPLQLGNVQWRYSAANALSSVLLLPYLGLALLILLSRAIESRNLAKAVGAGAVVVVVGLLASLTVFALDAVQLKAIVNSSIMSSFETTTVRVGVVTTLFLLAFSLIALAGFSRPRRRKVASSQRQTRRPDEDEERSLGRESVVSGR
jgi:hypothetical protein